MPKTSSHAAKTRGAEQAPAWSIPSLREPRYSQSLERGLAILSCFTAKRPVMGIADLADALGMSRSTTHRYVITLLALGYLEQVASRKYRLGLRVSDLGMSALNTTGLREHSHPRLDELRRKTGRTAGLALLDGAEILYVDSARSVRRAQEEIDLGLHPGSRLPAHCTAVGKVLLADLPEEQQRGLLAELKLAKRGPKTITGKKALREELDRVAKAGIAVSNEEVAARLNAIAAPVRNGSGQAIAAVGLVAPASAVTLKKLLDTHGPQLIETASEIAASLG
jgi:IclR family transcriptional regulator, pca regulon regulatory protein